MSLSAQLVSPKEAAAELLRRREALCSVEKYIHYMRCEGLPDFHYDPADHHLLMIRLLEAIMMGEEDRAAISLPPGSAKSFFFTVLGPTILLARYPHKKIICASASESLAEDFSRRRRQIMLTPAWERLSGTSLLADAKNLSFQGVKEGGGIYAVGAGSTIQGLRADYLIADDLVSGFEQAQNLAQLDKLWNWYLSEARARLRPHGAELMVATRWAQLDPIGRVLRLTEKGLENWRYLRVPLIADEENDPVGRKIGERLWPEYFTRRMVRDAQQVKLVFNTLYQQRPMASENEWVPPEHVHLVPRAGLPALKLYIGCDIALSIQKGDYTVFVVIGVDAERKFYLIDLWRRQADPDTSAQALVALCAQYHPVACWVDNDNASKMWARLVGNQAQIDQVPVPLRLSKMHNRDKETRAAALRRLFLQDRVNIVEADWTPPVLQEISEFPGGRNDDIVDAAAVVAKELHQLAAPTTPKEDMKQRILTALQEKDGRTVTRQTLDELWPQSKRQPMRI